MQLRLFMKRASINSGDYRPFLIPYREWMAEDDEFQKMELFRRFLNEPYLKRCH